MAVVSKVLCVAVLPALLGGVQAQVETAEAPMPLVLTNKPFDQAAFETHFSELGATAEQLAAFRAMAEEETVRIAVEEFLRELSPEYDSAATLAEDDDPRAALELTQLLEPSTDPYVRAFARYQLARVFLAADDPEQAIPVLQEFVAEDFNRTPLDAEAIYYYSNAVAMVPVREEAIRLFGIFLQMFPGAPERLRSSAAQIKAELEQQEGLLYNLSDLMWNVERRIRKTDTGEETQEKQKLVMTQLEKYIEQIEQLEQQAGGAPGGAGGINPAQNSALPGGEASDPSLEKAPPKMAKKWGSLKDDERKAIEAELSGKMSPRYRKMLEEYYKKLGKGRK